MKPTFVFGTVLLVLACYSAFAQEAERPVPSETEQQQALAAAKDVFGDEWRAAKTSEQKFLLAGKILQKASESKDDPAARYVLLRLGKDIATQAGDPDLAHKAIEEMATVFNIDPRQSKLDTFFAVAKQVPPAKRPSLISWATKMLSETVAADDFDNAKHVFAVLQATARQSKDRAVAQQVTAMGKELSQIAKAYEAVKPVASTENLSSDPAASLVVGRYQCFVKGNWAQGLDILKSASDEKFKTLASKELEGTMGKEVALADQWWEVSESLDGREADIVQLHAADLYRKALSQLSGLAKSRIEKRLAGVKTSVALTAEAQATPAILVSSLPAGAVLVLTFEPNTFQQQQNRTFVKDLSEVRRTGEVFGGRLTEGKVGQALDLNGDAWAIVPGDYPDEAKPRTLCLWSKADPKAGGFIASYGEILGKTSYFGVYLRTGDWLVTPLTGAGKCDEQWHHVVGTYDGKGTVVYFDGKRIQRGGALPAPTGKNTFLIGVLNLPKKPLQGTGFRGAIDELVLFDRVLSDEEIKQVYELGVNRQNLARRK